MHHYPITASYVSQVKTQGWKIIPTWVGKQGIGSSCSSCSKMSTDSNTAYSQGRTEADNAVNTLTALGMTNSVVYYSKIPIKIEFAIVL
jgi:hypothetical protein